MARCSGWKEISSKNSPLRGCLVNQWKGCSCSEAGALVLTQLRGCSALPGSEEQSLLCLGGNQGGEAGNLSFMVFWLVHLSARVVNVKCSEMGLFPHLTLI